MDAVYPRGGRWRRVSRQRHRTMPVTFAEIKVTVYVFVGMDVNGYM